jgi:hypothetical protein
MKTIIRILVYLIFASALFYGIKIQKEKITKNMQTEIVSFSKEWGKNGKPVYVTKIKLENFYILEKISGKLKSKNQLVSYVSKNVRDKFSVKNKFFINNDDLNQKIYGEISNISSDVNYETGLYQIDLTLNQPIKNFKNAKDDIFSCNIIISIIPNVILVPENVIQKDETGNFVFKIYNENLVKKVYIDLSISDGFYSIVKKGLNLNDLVVTEGNSILKNNDKIEIIKK